MKRILQFLTRLYPAWWRRRYGPELEALLEDLGSSWRDVWDLFQGAIQMQMSKLSFGRVVMVCGIAGLVVASVIVFSIPSRYVSFVFLKIPARDLPIDKVNEAAKTALNRSTLMNILIDQNLYPSERSRRLIEDVVENVMRPAIYISPQSDGVFVEFLYKEPHIAQKVTQSLAERFAGFQILEPAKLPLTESIPRGRIRMVGLGIGLLLGLVISLVLALIRRLSTLATN